MEVTFRIQWTETSVLNLKNIYDYYSSKASRAIAQKLIHKIIDSTIILENNPEAGKKEDLLEDRPEKFRFIVSNNYKILYWVDFENHTVFISMVFDTRQSPEKLIAIK